MGLDTPVCEHGPFTFIVSSIDGKTLASDRARIFHHYYTAPRGVVFSVGTLIEGFDPVHTDAILLARSLHSGSISRLRQLIARATRVERDRPNKVPHVFVAADPTQDACLIVLAAAHRGDSNFLERTEVISRRIQGSREDLCVNASTRSAEIEAVTKQLDDRVRTVVQPRLLDVDIEDIARRGEPIHISNAREIAAYIAIQGNFPSYRSRLGRCLHKLRDRYAQSSVVNAIMSEAGADHWACAWTQNNLWDACKIAEGVESGRIISLHPPFDKLKEFRQMNRNPKNEPAFSVLDMRFPRWQEKIARPVTFMLDKHFGVAVGLQCTRADVG